MQQAGIQSQKGFKKHKGFSAGDLNQVAPNTLARQFEVDEPNQISLTDFTLIRMHKGWLYLTIVLDLFSRQVVGWSMKNNLRADLVIDAPLVALRRRILKIRDEAKGEIFSYIELYYNPGRRHDNNDGVSPVEFEKQCFEKLSSVWRTGGAPVS